MTSLRESGSAQGPNDEGVSLLTSTPQRAAGEHSPAAGARFRIVLACTTLAAVLAVTTFASAADQPASHGKRAADDHFLSKESDDGAPPMLNRPPGEAPATDPHMPMPALTERMPGPMQGLPGPLAGDVPPPPMPPGSALGGPLLEKTAGHLRKRFGVDEATFEELFAQADRDGDGELEPPEVPKLVGLMMQQGNWTPPEFISLDGDHDGEVAGEELNKSEELLQFQFGVNSSEYQSQLAAADADSDGRLTTAEFRTLVGSLKMEGGLPPIPPVFPGGAFGGPKAPRGMGRPFLPPAPELREAFGVDNATFQKLFNEVDANGDGKLEPLEAHKLMGLLMQEGNWTPPMFNKTDKDHNGQVDSEELSGLSKTLRRRFGTNETLLSDADKDGDGQLDVSEFKDLLGSIETKSPPSRHDHLVAGGLLPALGPPGAARGPPPPPPGGLFGGPPADLELGGPFGAGHGPPPPPPGGLFGGPLADLELGGPSAGPPPGERPAGRPPAGMPHGEPLGRMPKGKPPAGKPSAGLPAGGFVPGGPPAGGPMPAGLPEGGPMPGGAPGELGGALPNASQPPAYVGSYEYIQTPDRSGAQTA